MKNAAFVFVAIVILASLPQASAQQRTACDALSALSQPNTSITLARTIPVALVDCAALEIGS
jgi:hypothetical protein